MRTRWAGLQSCGCRWRDVRQRKQSNRDCDTDALRIAYCGLADEHASAWSLEDFMDIKPKFTECPRYCLEEARIERWTNVGYAREVRGQAGKKGPFTMSYMCTACQLMPKDDFVWFLARNNGHGGTGRKLSGTSIHCALCGKRSKVKDMTCVDTVQCDNNIDSRLVFWAESSHHG